MKPLASLCALTVLATFVPIGFAAEPFPAKPRKVTKTDKEWAKLLTREQFLVTRMKATEPAFSGRYVSNHARGLYLCVCCGAELFSSRAKFESGTGWPSFYQPVAASHIETAPDYTMAEPRVEVECKDCGAHLGHVFNDGPAPTGLRFCINSASLKFVKESTTKSDPKAKKTAKTEKTDKAEKTEEAKSTSPSDAPPPPSSKP